MTGVQTCALPIWLVGWLVSCLMRIKMEQFAFLVREKEPLGPVLMEKLWDGILPDGIQIAHSDTLFFAAAGSVQWL